MCVTDSEEPWSFHQVAFLGKPSKGLRIWFTEDTEGGSVRRTAHLFLSNGVDKLHSPLVE